MKKLFIIGILGLVMGSAQAQQFFATNNLAATNNTIFTSGKVLQNITLWSTNASPTLVYLYDGGLTATNGNYTNFTYTTSQQVLTVVGYAGLTNLYTNTVIAYTANPVATNSAAVTLPRYTFVVPGSSTPFSYTFNPSATFVNKLSLTNSLTGLNVLLQYRNP